MKYYVYKHTFSNGIVYFGKGQNNRINSNKRNRYWNNLYKKYGEPQREYLNTNISEDLAFILEQAYIACSRNLGIKDCNMTVGGEGVSGYSHTQKAKQSISSSLKGRPKSEATKAKMAYAQKTRKRNKSNYKSPDMCNRKAVQQYTKDMKLVSEFISIQEASRSTGINNGNISSVCNGKYSQAGGYCWKYKLN